jgi:hypothetical protein
MNDPVTSKMALQPIQPPPSRDVIRLGELGDRWRFPSDHIPVAAVVSGVRLGTWNVLNSKWVGFFADNHEGLAASNIVTDNSPIRPGTTWTKRDGRVLETALALISRLDLLLLQECGNEFIRELLQRLPKDKRLLKGRQDSSENDIVAIFDSKKLTFDPKASVLKEDGYSCKPGKPIMNMLFHQSDGDAIRVFHTHVPGDPQNPGIHEFARYVAAAQDTSFMTIAAGDLNFLAEQVKSAFFDAGVRELLSLISLNTSVGSGMVAKGIDHILVLNARDASTLISADELSAEIAQASALLNPD